MTKLIRVPASTANLGPGFDSIGVALTCYLTLTVGQPTADWHITHNLGDDVPSDATNFVIAEACRLVPDLAPHALTMTSDIPLARGLGSSSSALLAAIALTNVLGPRQDSPAEMLALATEREHHPDNVAPALLGGGVVAYADSTTGAVYHAPLALPVDLAFIAFIPDYELKTSDARDALPAALNFGESVTASAIANTLIASLAVGDWSTASRLIEADHFHESARLALVPHLATIRSLTHAHGLNGTYLSGAGPTVMTVVPEDHATALLTDFKNSGLTGRWEIFHIDTAGLVISDLPAGE